MEITVPESAAELKSWLRHLDEVLLKKALEWARQCYKAILEKLDDVLVEHRSRDLRIERRRGVWYQSCLGPVRVMRRLYGDREGRWRCLLDDLMGMTRYRHTTSSVQEFVLEMASTMPFRRGAEAIRCLDKKHVLL